MVLPHLTPLPPLPIDGLLPAIQDSLARETRLIIEAAPGAGKTTRVPLTLLSAPWLASGTRLLMLEPRRLAARAAAQHMAALRGEAVGQTVGYRTAIDSKESRNSRILVVTEGILTRMIQADPALEDVGCVIFDEFHERSIQADLGLALCLDSQQDLRPDLRLVVMSATLDGERLAAMLDDCPRLSSGGVQHPVEIRYQPAPRADLRPEDHAAAVIRRLLSEEDGSLLAFFPGAREIRRAAELLSDLPSQIRVHPLYGDLGPEEQDSAVTPCPPGVRKVVLATNIAESSLTIEGVRLVVDSGLERASRFAPDWGMNRLITERIARASADQRAGRAGRLGPGLCLRLWPEQEQARLRSDIRPEMLEADLAPLCLEVAAWGLPVGSVPAELRWLDAPPAANWEQARQTLHALDALDAAHRCTRRGLDMAALPLHPRLAHMVLEGKARNQGAHACALAALFSERDPLRGAMNGTDVHSRLALLLDAKSGGQSFLREQMRRLAARAGVSLAEAEREDREVGPLVALAWPERVALRRDPGTYLLANGRGAALSADDPLCARDCLAVAVAQATYTGGDARIHLAAPLDRNALEDLFADHIYREQQLVWEPARKAVAARRVRKLGALTLTSAPWPDPPIDAVQQILLEAVAGLGLDCLPWTPKLRALQGRMRFVRALACQGTVPDTGWPDWADRTLTATLQDWLGPFLGAADRLSAISPAMLEQAFQAMLPWPLPGQLDALAPEHLTAPSGSLVRLDYSNACAPPRTRR